VGDDGQPLDTSTPGTWVDLAGYGGELPVVAPGGEGYRVEAGSGVAAAQVAGAAALVRSRFPGLSALEVAQRLTASANPVGGGRDPRTGAGLVDPFGALTHLGDDGAGGDDSGTARAGRIPVQALPRPEPLMSDTVATALAWAGVLLLAVVLGLLAAPAVRRAAGRGWRAGPAPGGEDAARGGAANRPVPPPGGRLDWLDGSDVPRPGATRQPMGTLRNRTR
jgi:subtilisin family serine protease